MSLGSDFYYILSDPTPERLARMLLAGQQSAFPKILFIANRMKIERLVEEGLLLGGSGKRDLDGINERISMHLHGQALRSVGEPSTDTGDEGEHRYHLSRGDRRSSVLEELKRQSGVFFDDVAGDETGESEEDLPAPKRYDDERNGKIE